VYIAMKAAQDRLVRHLVTAVAVKLVVLTVLWWAFVRDDRIDVDVERAAAHLGATAEARPSIPDTRGAQP
jgi:hypothetical protein